MKTTEQKLNETKKYLANAKQHLFVVNDKMITKVITFTKNDKDYYAKLVINGDKINITIFDASSMKWDVKYTLFPQYVKTKSIPYFKKMREIVELVEKQLQVIDFLVCRTTELVNKDIKEKINSFELVK